MRKAISIKDELENWAIDHFIWNHARFFFVFVFFVSVLYLSFFLGSFLYLFLFFPYFHFFLSIFISCEWVINRLKVGCKFSTIRFVLLLQCCLLIVCPGYIYSGDSRMAAFPSFSTTYRRYLQKAKFLRISPLPFLYSSMCDWPVDYENNNRRNEMDSMQMRDKTWWMPHLKWPILIFFIYLFIYLFHILENVCVWGVRGSKGRKTLEELKKEKKKRKRYVYVRAV